jgi:integrase
MENNPLVQENQPETPEGGETSLAISPTPQASLAAKIEQTQAFIAQAKADNTIDAYKSDWEHFVAWCAQHKLSSLPATEETVAVYLADLAATHAPASLTRRLTPISRAHLQAGYRSPARLRESPLLADTLGGIRRVKGVAQRSAKPILLKDIVKMLDHLEGPIKAARDKALLLVDFASAMRRSELVAVTVPDLEWSTTGVTIRIPRSKRDQEGRGQEVELVYGANRATCPVSALKDWMSIAPIEDGPVFRKVMRSGKISKVALNPESVTWIVRRALKAAGVSGARLAQYSAHSLRAGFCTQASLHGASEIEIMQQSRHRSVPALRRYIREGKQMQLRVAGKLGL